MSILTSRKFRVDILTIFITIFLTSILGITYYFYSRSNEAVLRVANGFISRTIDSITQKLDEFLQPTPLIGIANLIMNDLKLDNADMNALASYMHVILNSYPQLVNAYIADTKGNIFIENRISNQTISSQITPFLRSDDIPASAKFISEMITRSGDIESVKLVYKNEFGVAIEKARMSSINFDPRSRPWFMSAKESGRSMWIGIYSYNNLPSQVMTIAFPIYSGNQFMGVAAADLSVSAIREAMDRFSIDTQGVVFIANHHGQIIAYQDQPGSTTHQSKDALIKTASSIHMQNDESNFIFNEHGVTYIAYFKSYSVSGKEEWEIAAIVPIDVFVGSINQANRKVLIFSLSTLIVGLILVVMVSNRISRPIIKIADETQDMQHFNFKKVTNIQSYIYEIQVMVAALNTAKSSLYSFSKYVPRVLVEQLLRLGGVAEPGGEKKKITILFSDIENFTSSSEIGDPNQLMEHLSDYLDTLTKCIHRHHGNIDKYIGDSVMAFWGAPQEDDDQVYRACLALLDCKREMHRFAKASALQGKPVFGTRFGLNTGLAIVGNLGSSDRLNYTAIGDTVNAASRLENINKIYGTEILVSEDVYLAVSDFFLFRPIDTVILRGRKAPIKIFELISAKDKLTEFSATDAQIRLCVLFNDAYLLYQSGEFKRALFVFNEIAILYPNDRVTKLYIQRCHDQEAK